MTCTKCHKHRGTEIWVGEGGIMAWSHGMSSQWCKCCVLKAQIKYAKEAIKNLVSLEKKLAKVKCI